MLQGVVLFPLDCLVDLMLNASPGEDPVHFVHGPLLRGHPVGLPLDDEARKVGTVNAVKPAPEQEKPKRDSSNDRVEKIEAIKPDGTKVTVDLLTRPVTVIAPQVRDLVAVNEGYFVEDVFSTPGFTVEGGHSRRGYRCRHVCVLLDPRGAAAS